MSASYRYYKGKIGGRNMIAERIKESREKNGLTQSSLAKKLGLSRSAINAWEMGISVPSAQYLVELSKLFKVSTDYLLGIDRKETIDITFLDEEEKNIIYLLLKHFEKYKRAMKILDNNGYTQLEEDYEWMKKNGVPMPEYISKMFHEMFG